MKLEATMGIGREHTDSELRRNGGQSVGLDTSIDLPRDFTVGLNGDYRRTNYDGRGSVLPWLASEDRRDRTQTLSVSLYNRSFTIQGFSPKLVVTREPVNPTPSCRIMNGPGGTPVRQVVMRRHPLTTRLAQHPLTPTARLLSFSVGFLAAAFAIAAPQPAFAGLEFCNRTAHGSTLSLALAYYNFGNIHRRFRKDGSTGLTITVNPRWTIRGWWDIPHNECITAATDRDPNLKHYYYYARSQDTSYEDSGNYLLCGRKYGRFHVEYRLSRDNEPVQVLAFNTSRVQSVPVTSTTDLEAACADLGYRLLPFNQLEVGGNESYTHEIF